MLPVKRKIGAAKNEAQSISRDVKLVNPKQSGTSLALIMKKEPTISITIGIAAQIQVLLHTKILFGRKSLLPPPTNMHCMEKSSTVNTGKAEL